ncbi:MAG: DNA topoisomerase IV subunit A [Candidatus Nanoarchaeia archaeon]|nr:DNA topoisomerase IV subunit A [Candidatus Nanoarchaeia archaeon]
MEKAKAELRQLGKKIEIQTSKKQNPTLIFPLRGLSNIEFDKKSSTLKLGDKTASRSFFNVAHSKKFLQTLDAARISHNLLKEKKHASLRDVFYQMKRTITGTKTNIVDDQTESDAVIEDLELITGCSREQLNINANKNGSVAGNVIVEDKGDIIDWSKMGSGGWSIPSNVEEIKFKKVQAKYVLYMEKAAVWERLHEDKFWEKQNCLIMSSQGQTTRGVRRLLQRLYEEHKLPIYVLTDLDPWGFYIYSVIKYGSISLAHMSEQLTIPGVKFLGITVDDIKKYNLEPNLIKFKDVDIKRIDQIKDYDWFKDNKDWQRQLNELKKLKAKAEIQALSARGISFISEKYLPEKIKNKEFID